MLLDQRVETSEGVPDGLLPLDWDGRRKTRFHATLADGRHVEVRLERPRIGESSYLADGDLLQGQGPDGGSVVVAIVAAPEPLIEVRCAHPFDLARCAYHLGNRHAAVQVLPAGSDGVHALRTAADPVMMPMLEGLGAQVLRIEAPFTPEVGAYAHHHDHTGRHDATAARIHRFVPKGG
jgi:urease accessory protein